MVAVWLAAGCSANGGFGTPVTEPNPVNAYPQNGVVSPEPSTSGIVYPGADASPSPAGSPSPTPTPVPNTLSIVGAALRLAYDGSAKDPVKAPRLLELAFALQNTTRNTARITTVSAHAGATPFPNTTVAVSAAPNQTSNVESVVLKTPSDAAKYQSVQLSFLDDQKKMIGSAKLDVPPQDTSFTSLDQGHPKGLLSIDSAEVSPISNASGLSFECTFALTNAGAAPASISEFDIAPPKGSAIKIAIPVTVPMRSASSFVSIVVPFNGKSLPSGSYVVNAEQSGMILARTSVVLL